jgi:hypothetical protein
MSATKTKVPFQYDYFIEKDVCKLRLIRLDNLFVYVGQFSLSKNKYKDWKFFQQCYSKHGKRRMVSITDEKLYIELILPNKETGITLELLNVATNTIPPPTTNNKTTTTTTLTDNDEQNANDNWCFKLFC